MPARRSSDGDGCAAAVPAWRGEAVDQFQRRQKKRAVPARTELGTLIKQAFGIEFA